MRIFAYNSPMNHLDILIPFSLVPDNMARDLLRSCEAPALAHLLARAKSTVPTRPYSGFARALAHEFWAASHLGLVPEPVKELHQSPAIAAALMANLGVAQTQGHWFVVQPVNFEVGMSHVSLTAVEQLALSEVESRALFDAAKPYVEENGKTLVYGDASTWFMRADAWQDFVTSTPNTALGRNIDIWLPDGVQSRDWRRLHNEVQMLWHTHPVNDQRTQRGAKAANALWLWGQSNARMTAPTNTYDAVINPSAWMAAVTDKKRQYATPDSAFWGHDRALLILEQLIEPTLSEEWGVWLYEMQALDSTWFAPALTALKSGQLKTLRLVLTGSESIAEYTISAASLRKFWVKPSLTRLSA
jgi:hypothetical protein